LRVR